MICPKCHNETVKTKNHNHCYTCQGDVIENQCFGCGEKYLGVRFSQYVWNNHVCDEAKINHIEAIRDSIEDRKAAEPLYGNKLEEGFKYLNNENQEE